MKKMKKIFWLTLIALLIMPLESQSHDKWTISLEPVYMSMYNDLRVGDIYSFYVTDLDIPQDGSIPGEYSRLYGTNYDPVVLVMPYKATIIWEINREGKNKKWGFGMRGWGFKKLASKGDVITQPNTEYGEDGSVTSFVNGFRMLDYVFLPFNEDGDMPIDWWAKNYLRIWTQEIYVFRTFSSVFNARLGIKIAEIFNSHDIGQRHWTTENTNRTYAMTSKTDCLVSGPNLGFDIRTKRFNVLIQQSILFGKSLHAGNWSINDYILEPGEGLTDSSQTPHTEYNIPSDANAKKIIPATELNIKLLIKEKKLAHGRSIKFGASFFVSAFWQSPMAYNWRVVKLEWRKKRQDLIFSGVGVNMEIKF